MDSIKLKGVKADSLITLRKENEILKRRLQGFEQITQSLSLEIDRQEKIISELRESSNNRNIRTKRRNIRPNRKAA